MNKKVLLILALAIVMISCVGCARITTSGQIVSGNRIVSGLDVQRFDYGYVILGNRVMVEGPVDQWRDYEDSDVVQVMIGGVYYLTHYSNVVLAARGTNFLGFTPSNE